MWNLAMISVPKIYAIMKQTSGEEVILINSVYKGAVLYGIDMDRPRKWQPAGFWQNTYR
jgi:hypothetical protein